MSAGGPDGPTAVTLRPATAADGPALLAALVEAVGWDGDHRLTGAQVLAEPSLAHYVAGWPRPGDVGVVAVEDGAGAGVTQVVGAAWCRLLPADDPGYGFVADDVPELAMGVALGHRGRGTGGALLAAVLTAAAARGHRAVSLSVADGNRARALYERAGFAAVGRNADSATMLLELDT